MNKRRKLVIALGAGEFVAPLGSFAQPMVGTYCVGTIDYGAGPSGLFFGMPSSRHCAIWDTLKARMWFSSNAGRREKTSGLQGLRRIL
jgi:hypothetical protein